MREVILMISGNTIKINMSRVFCGKNPRTEKYSVYIMDDDNEKEVRLFCKDQYNHEEAAALVQKIRDGKITDLTGYLAEWNKK